MDATCGGNGWAFWPGYAGLPALTEGRSCPGSTDNSPSLVLDAQAARLCLSTPIDIHFR
jgi:hypothetical protein